MEDDGLSLDYKSWHSNIDMLCASKEKTHSKYFYHYLKMKTE